jgi:uncharacterized protein YndB with AHSA1/START domain
MKVDATIRIAAPPDAVAAVLVDPELAPRWQRHLVRMEVVRGEANEVGSLARLHYEQRGRAYVMDDELLECEPNRRWRSRVSGNGMTALVETRLASAGSGTEVHLNWDGRPDRWLARLLFPLLARVVRRGVVGDLKALKRCVEHGGHGAR